MNKKNIIFFYKIDTRPDVGFFFALMVKFLNIYHLPCPMQMLYKSLLDLDQIMTLSPNL